MEYLRENNDFVTEVDGQQKIVNALISNPSVSRKQLATLIGDITEDGIKIDKTNECLADGTENIAEASFSWEGLTPW